ncbi:MAG: DUF2996 domain-containing protein [Acaryochloridaceae cyanobacterium SU_2_1]|nr:DUF2996 domain-containing protein [Acaryochloridaceae cyanobacterium SU_2_1]
MAPKDTAPAAPAEAETAPAKAKEKKPALEDKPFSDFIEQDYLPALTKAFGKQDIQDLKLQFLDNQVTGTWLAGNRGFTVYFPEANIQKQRAFSCSLKGQQPSTIEPFLIDERKVNLELLVFGVIQRLNAQKWLGNN